MSAITGRTLFKSIVSSAYRGLRFKNTYNAAVLEAPGKPLEIKEVKRKKLHNDQVRIQVSYCAINCLDMENIRSEGRAVPFTPGHELSGEVLELGGHACEKFNIGEKVAALSLANYGGLAEEIVVDKNEVFRVPPNVTLQDAAVVIFGHTLALYTFGKLSSIKERDRIVISVGPAGLGLAAVDVAANIYKSKVIAVTGTEAQSELTREKGAFETLHFDKNLKKNISKILKNKGADVVYNAAGTVMMEELNSTIRDKGLVFNACPTIGKTVPTPPPHSSFTVVSLSKLKEQNLEEYRQIVCDTLEMADEGIITAHISEKFNLVDVNAAMDFIDSKTCTGKVLVQMI